MARTVATLFLFVILFSSGCLVNHEHRSIVRQDEPLYPITFESEQARVAFEACVETACDDDHYESNSSFGVPFIVGISRSQMTSETAIRNDTATRLDVNGDRHISEYEVSMQ